MIENANPVGERFWLLVEGVPDGPFTVPQIHAKLAGREVTWETQACQLGESTWLPLVRTPGVGPTLVSPGVSSVDPVPPVAVTASAPVSGTAVPRPDHTDPGKMVAGKLYTGPGWWKVSPFVLGVIFVALVRGCMASNHPASAPPMPHSITTPAITDVAARQHTSATSATGRIDVSATDGTAALQALAAQLPPDQLQALGLSVLLTGVDIYGMEVRIRNTGTVPVRFFPSNLRVHYGQETVGVRTADHPLFLQLCVIQPGSSVEGLIMYQAAVDVGAEIRFLGTSFSYNDPSVTVTYGL